MLALAACAGDGPSSGVETSFAAATASTSHRRCGWIGLGNYEDGVASFTANTAYFEAIHPVWYQIGADSVSVVAFSRAGDPRIVGTTAQLQPTIEDSGSAAVLRTLVNDPAKRQAHIANLVSMVVNAGYMGLDVDYEHLWTSADRPGYEAFVNELVAAMHAQGREVSVTIPGLAVPDVDSAYDYVDLAASGADHFHIMAYDFHTVGTHAGPVAPLGWVDAIAGQAAATGAGARFILGLPNYGVTPTWYSDSATCAATCGARYATTTSHMRHCSYGSWNAGRAPNCRTANGDLFFDDLASLKEKVGVASAHSLGGITYWALGGEPSGFFAMVAAAFP